MSLCQGVRAFNGTALDLSASRHYDLSEPQLLEWCLHMIEQKRFRSFLSEPPCTTFSPAAHPAVRCYEIPEGFNLSCPKTHQGNFLCNRSFVLLKHVRHHGVPCGKKQPRLAWRRAWKSSLRDGFEESACASCPIGSPHKKEFRVITYLLDHIGFGARCPGGHSHIKMEGALTKGSAVYV